jgi:predicted DNA-binding transcriptional regulator AlpA
MSKNSQDTTAQDESEIGSRRFQERDLCKKYRCSRATLFRWVRDGLFPPPMKIGVTRRWREEDLAKWEAAKAA